MYITLGVSLAGPYSSPIPPLKATGCLLLSSVTRSSPEERFLDCGCSVIPPCHGVCRQSFVLDCCLLASWPSVRCGRAQLVLSRNKWQKGSSRCLKGSCFATEPAHQEQGSEILIMSHASVLRWPWELQQGCSGRGMGCCMSHSTRQ